MKLTICFHRLHMFSWGRLITLTFMAAWVGDPPLLSDGPGTGSGWSRRQSPVLTARLISGKRNEEITFMTFNRTIPSIQKLPAGSMADGQDYFIILLVLSVLLNFIFPVLAFLSPPFTYFGFLIIGFGFVLALWSRSLFLKNSTTLQPSEEPTSLVTSGPFRISRNPIYLGMASILLGVAVLHGNTGRPCISRHFRYADRIFHYSGRRADAGKPLWRTVPGL